jgi:Spy/CpxP family protein refolding chaperone
MTASSPRARIVGIMALLAVFVAGGAAGVAADRLWSSGRGIRVKLEARNSGILDKLGLTPEQRSRAEAIMERKTPRTEGMLMEVGERLQLIADSVDAELRAILTPEQRMRLDSLGAGQRLLLKRKVVRPGGGETTDTVFPRRNP